MKFLNRYTSAIALLLIVVVFSPDPGRSKGIAAFHDFAHAPVFGCVAFLMLSWLKGHPSQRRGVWTEYLMAFGVAVGLGLATEIAQKLAGRDSSWFDLYSDTLGAAVFAALFALFDERLGRLPLRIVAAFAGAIALVFHSLPMTRIAIGYWQRNEAFPVLYDANEVRAEEFAVARRADFHYALMPQALAKRPNELVLRVKFRAGRFPWMAFELEEPYPDWSSYRTLNLELANAGDEPLPLTLRVHDRTHNWRVDDRFNRRFALAPRTRLTYSVPLDDIARAPKTRRLDLRQVADLMVFTPRANAGRELYISRIWLE